MNFQNINQYLQKIDHAVQFCNGDLLSAYFSYKQNYSNCSKLRTPNPEASAAKILYKPYDELAVYHLKCLYAIQDGDILEAFQNQNSLLLSFIKLFDSQKDQNWMLRVMHVICVELRLLAGPADNFADDKKHPVKCMEKTADTLMLCFRKCAADNRASDKDTKKWGMMLLVNQMLKVYFKINRHHLCKPLMRAIDLSPLKDKFSLAQRVTYNFFAGQRAMFDGDYKKADEYFSFSFTNCHPDANKNKRSILLYLIPVKMNLGLMPKKELLQKYNLMEFWDLVEAIKQGNLQKFNIILDQNRLFFIKHSIYLIMKRLSTIATRNLFKKVYHIHGSHQIPVELFLKALLAMKIEDASWDEAECLLANLILDGLIKGYISYQHDTLVVSKLNPFPVISTIK